MNLKHLWRTVLVITLVVITSPGAHAQAGWGRIGPDSKTIVAAIVGVVAAIVVVAFLALHYSTKKRVITGCVNSNANGISVTDENHKHTYILSGNTAGIKPGERMSLRGKKVKPSDKSTAPVWETIEVAKDFGACHN